MEGQKLLTVKDLKTYFYTSGGVSKAVDGVSFEVQKGEILGIVGESGSGKSVTSSSIIHLLPAKTGKIVGGSIDFNGTDVLKLSQKELLEFRGKDISMIFQNPMTSLSPVFKVGSQMVEMICAHQKVTKAEARNMAEEALKRVGIPDARRRMEAYPYELSGGMCQRVIIAMSVCSKPQMIIADEPTTALDVTVQAQVLEQLNKLRKESNTALIIITHNLGVVARYADTVKIMYGGKIVESGTPFDIFENPQHPYTIGLVRAVPRLDLPRSHGLHTIPGEPPDMSRIPEQSCAFAGRCPHATQECHTKRPPFVSVGEGHECACFHMDETKAEREALV